MKKVLVTGHLSAPVLHAIEKQLCMQKNVFFVTGVPEDVVESSKAPIKKIDLSNEIRYAPEFPDSRSKYHK